MNQNTAEKLYTLKEACEFLSISTATARNWMKSGRLVSISLPDQKPVFEETALISLKTALSSGALHGLKSRRNKSYVSGQGSYRSYISKTSDNQAALALLCDILEKEKKTINDPLLLGLLRACAEQLIVSAGYSDVSLFESLLDSLITSKDFSAFKVQHTPLCEISYTYYPKEDTLGFLYLSLCNLKNRKASGSYYTPAWLANRLVSKHLTMLDDTKTVLDPSCGTGIFLLQLPENLPLENLHGNDLNPVSVVLTQINLALKYHITTPEELEILQKNISVSNFLTSTWQSYDIILGNPPWGAKLTEESKKMYQEHFTCASLASPETFDLFIEQSLHFLNPKGILSFVIPESLLTVKAHQTVRELLLQNTSVLSVEYLGEVFEQVHCPSIILTVSNNPNRSFFKNVSITLKNGTMFSTNVDRAFQADSFGFSMTDDEYLLLQKIISNPNCTTLVNKAAFALGIVTGNNSSLLHSTPGPGLEPVIKGSDISKYHINTYSGYLQFKPDQFQQTAQEAYYRAPEKLFYRFINKQLIFAYDATGLLSLNSCNIVIPNIPELSIKYILAILNSSVAQFVFEKKFHSVKVLRSHLEQIPIPMASKEHQQEIVALVNQLMNCPETSLEYKEAYTLLDLKIAKLFELTEQEYQLISAK